MPRYNLNQDDISIIVDALNKRADIAWNPQEQARIRRLILRLEGKVNALNQNVNTAPIQKQDLKSNEQPIVYDDAIWNFYTSKDN